MNAPQLSTPVRLVLNAETAADLMTPNPISIRADATVQDALVLISDKGISAAPVIDEAGHPVGVVSRSDILLHERESSRTTSAVPEYFRAEDLGAAVPLTFPSTRSVPVSSIMTPVVFSVRPDTPAPRVLEELQAMKVHRLFVVDESGVLVGVVSLSDLLLRIQAE